MDYWIKSKLLRRQKGAKGKMIRKLSKAAAEALVKMLGSKKVSECIAIIVDRSLYPEKIVGNIFMTQCLTNLLKHVLERGRRII